MKKKFAIGDRVVVVSHGTAPDDTVGLQGVVTRVDCDALPYYVELPGDSWWYSATMLKMATALKFNVGDKVVIAEKGDSRNFETGTVQRHDGSTTLPYHIQFDDGEVSYYDEKYLKTAAKPRKAPKGKQSYKGNGNHTWELVTEAGLDFGQPKVYRLRVQGGWIYKPRGSSGVFVKLADVTGYVI